MTKINKPSADHPEKGLADEDKRSAVKGIVALLGLGAAGLLNGDPDHQPKTPGEEKYEDKSSKKVGDVAGGGEPEGAGGKGSPEGSCIAGWHCSPEKSLWCENKKKDSECYCTPQATCDDSPGKSCKDPCRTNKDGDCVPPHKWECF